MTVTGEVIRVFFDPIAKLLINVRAVDNGWMITVIDTHVDQIIKRIEFASRSRAEHYAAELARRIGARRIEAHSLTIKADPSPDPRTIRYTQE